MKTPKLDELIASEYMEIHKGDFHLVSPLATRLRAAVDEDMRGAEREAWNRERETMLTKLTSLEVRLKDTISARDELRSENWWLKASNANLIERVRELVETGESLGWNGTDNSKILSVFFRGIAEERYELRAKLASSEHVAKEANKLAVDYQVEISELRAKLAEAERIPRTAAQHAQAPSSWTPLRPQSSRGATRRSGRQSRTSRVKAGSDGEAEAVPALQPGADARPPVRRVPRVLPLERRHRPARVP